MPYDYSNPRLGVTGWKHPSNAEARASFRLHEMGIVPSNAYYKGPFLDRYRNPFKAKTDFQSRHTDLKVEFKAGILNAQDSKQDAEHAMICAKRDYKYSRINAKQFATLTQEGSWSNSLSKQLVVQKVESPLNMVVAFESLPDAAEQARLNRNRLVWTTLDSISEYSLFAVLANLGHSVAYANHGYRISTIPSDQDADKQ